MASPFPYTKKAHRLPLGCEHTPRAQYVSLPGVARQYPVRQKPLTLASPLGTLQAMRGGFKTVATAQAAPAARITSYSRLLPCATDSASSRVRTGAFARLTVCLGCC